MQRPGSMVRMGCGCGPDGDEGHSSHWRTSEKSSVRAGSFSAALIVLLLALLADRPGVAASLSTHHPLSAIPSPTKHLQLAH